MLPTIPILAPPDIQIPAIVRPAEEKPKVIKYEVVAGDTLESIASEHNTDVLRLFYANKALKHPDQIEAGMKLIVPSKDEKLEKREVPVIIENRVGTGAESSHLGSFSGLMGSIGRVSPYGNCVNEPGVNNPGWGSPYQWPVLFYEPRIGATALWTYNHTGYIVGIWENGDLEINHQNWGGAPRTRFSQSEMRGYR